MKFKSFLPSVTAVTLAVSMSYSATSQAVIHTGPDGEPVNKVDATVGAKALSFTLITGDVAHATVNNRGEMLGARLTKADGSEVVWSTLQVGPNLYLIPAEAQPLVDAGKLDKELFNLTRLYQSGYDDERSEELSVIVEYEDGTSPVQVSNSRMTHRFDVIDSASLALDKEGINSSYSELTSDSRIKSVWLDKVFQSMGADLPSPTVPLTGALSAYQAGFDGTGVTVAVLDTGYDFAHPDLNGQVVDVQSFVWGSEGQDLDGHGTHVAGSIAGTGVASDGLYTGVAPGSKLIVGKVLNDNGSGSMSGILNGMYWAVESGADIVNMSLGASGGSDCVGPAVDMLEALSDRALFVVAAGNSYTRKTVSTPGCSPKALTVGAIDRDGNTAEFSSRGPSVDGKTAKPDIASQGVDVVSASTGGISGNEYRLLSGTSMATPHVAGGAAIVLQANPELTPTQLKAVLTSSVAPTDAPVLEQGAGPMDVAQAVEQNIVGHANLSLGDFYYPYEYDVTEKHVTLSNLSDKDITLHLKLKMIGDDGDTNVPAKLVKLNTRKVVVPAHGDVDVPVTVDASAAIRNSAYGTITGRLTGTSKDGDNVVVPVSVWFEEPKSELNITAYDRFGNPAESPSAVSLLNHEDQTVLRHSFIDGQAHFTVPSGQYSIVSSVMTRDEPSNQGLVESVTFLADLERIVDGDTDLVLDARKGHEIEFDANNPLDMQGFSGGFTYDMSANDRLKASVFDYAPKYVENVYGWSHGRDENFNFVVTTRATAPMPELQTSNGTPVEYLSPSLARMFDGEGSLEMVYVGDGSREAFEAVDVEGKIAFIDAEYFIHTPARYARDAGVAGMVANFPNSVGRHNSSVNSYDFPIVTVTADMGAVLKQEMSEGPVELQWSGFAPESSPYAYSLVHQSSGKVSTGKVKVNEGELASVNSQYFSQGDERIIYADVYAHVPGAAGFYSTGTSQMIKAPIERVEYFSPETVGWTNKVMPMYTNGGGSFEGPVIYSSGHTEDTTWYKGPFGSSQLTNSSVLVNRFNNEMKVSIPHFGDAAGHDSVASPGMRDRLSKSIEVNGERAYAQANGMVPLPESPALVTIGNGFMRRADFGPANQRIGVAYETVWSFMTDSSMQGPQPVIVPSIDVPSDLDNAIPAGEPATLSIKGLVDGLGSVPLASVQVEYAYGTQQNLRWPVIEWQSVEATQSNGDWSVTIPNDSEAGQYVHLRVVLSDHNGSTVDQSMVRAYLLK
ncbi:S8 family serine peptidase [Kangiella geojedonensis]|uniref:Peptidase S8 and S53, subtilisin, kexin, sedolisin n=1 Tax=Kangiella geojedonensis TaxID=914150 RepID=A0A0F6TPW6_9GAMM|nr:S8 family serine peptidase [Kangiella geojedonensis]AKE51739.1 Peptidase S8 and S53, subtilisin, kexin, sedolisin [Kangiella geojedonensis]